MVTNLGGVVRLKIVEFASGMNFIWGIVQCLARWTQVTQWSLLLSSWRALNCGRDGYYTTNCMLSLHVGCFWLDHQLC